MRKSESKKFRAARREAVRRLEEAKSKGLLEGPDVKIFRDKGWLARGTAGEAFPVKRESEFGIYPETPETYGIIVRPEGTTKPESKETARHEVGHILRGDLEEHFHGSDYEEWGDFENWFKRELGASITFPVDRKHFPAARLARYTIYGIRKFNLTHEEAWRVVSDTATSLGLPYKTIKRARKLLREYEGW